LPPAFSAFCLVTFLLAAWFQADALSGALAGVWKLGMFVVSGVLSLYYLRRGPGAMVVVSWVYGAAVALVTLMLGAVALFMLFGMP
jgi:hypothetical protein